MIFKIFNSIRELPKTCDVIFAYNEKTSLFFGKTWFSLYEQFFLNQNTNRFVVIFDENKLPLIIFLTEEITKKTHRYFPIKQAIIQSTNNYYSASFSPLTHADITIKQLKQAYSIYIQEFLIKQKIDSIHLNSLFYNEEHQLLLNELKQFNFVIETDTAFANWTFQLKGLSYKDYFQQRPSRVRNTLKRKIKKLEKDNNYQVHIYQTPEAIQKHLIDYERIYHLSWKPEEASDDFIRTFMLTYAKKRQTRLGIIYVNNVAVASQFWLVHNETALIYKLAYDPAYKQYSIGTILTAHMMEYAIDTDKVKKLDYLTGDDQYKKDWMNNRHEYINLTAYNTKTSYGLWLATKLKTKKIIKRLLGNT